MELNILLWDMAIIFIIMKLVHKELRLISLFSFWKVFKNIQRNKQKLGKQNKIIIILKYNPYNLFYLMKVDSSLS